MEEIFKQSFSFAQIRLFKNYSNLDKVNTLHEVSFDDITEDNIAKKMKEDPFRVVTLDQFTSQYIASTINRDKIYTLRLYPKDNNRKFFYASEDCPRNIPKDGKYVHDYHGFISGAYETVRLVSASPVSINSSYDWFDTTKDTQIKRHYMNPFAGISIHKIERWIKKDGDKITIKVYQHFRERKMNSKYFTKRSKSITMTFNLKTGNFTAINFDKSHNHKSGNFYTNTFMSLKTHLAQIYDVSNLMSPRSTLYPQFTKEFDIPTFHFAIRKAFNFNKPNLLWSLDAPFSKTDVKLIAIDFFDEWIPKFIDAKKIKAPNHCNRLLTNFYPTEKYLKKNERKLVASILDRFGVKSNVTIKILHEHPDMNMLSLVRLCYIFGKNYPKYIGNIKLGFFDRYTNMEKMDDMYAKNALLDTANPRFMELQEGEKGNLIKIINDYITNLGVYDIGTNHALVDYIYDHFNMMKRVREYYPDMRLTARTYEVFSNQHIELSKIENTIKRGYTIEYVFDETTVREIERPIIITRLGDLDLPAEFSNITDKTYVPGVSVNLKVDAFTPVILKTGEEYSEEGSYMHHCVSSYINTETSMIISLRIGRERVTCEFYTKNGSCVQARYFNNQNPPEHYREALGELNDRLRKSAGRLAPLEKKKIRLQINGKDIVTEAPEVYPFLVEDYGLPL